jgi:hypothetical protein
MHSPGQAIAWLFWWRHRWGLLAGIAYLLVAVSTVALVPAELRTQRGIGLNLTVGGLAVILHLMVVFTFGFETDLANKESGYPPRMFVLPLATGTLVRWPMLGGLAAISLAWLVLAGLVLRPCGFGIVWWPWACLTALLSVLQALAWMPFSSSYQRLVIVLLLAGVSALAGMGLIWLEAPRGLFIAAFVMAWLGGYWLAMVAVTRARRGDPVRWPWSSIALKRADGGSHSVAPTLRGGEAHSFSATAPHLPVAEAGGYARVGRPPRASRTPAAFHSATTAQLWYEFRRHGWLLPLFMGGLLLFAMPVLFILPNHATPPWRTATFVLAIAPFLAGIGSAAFAKEDPFAKTYELSSFAATRPLTSAQMVGIKLATGGISAGLMCGLTLIALAAWFFREGVSAGFAPLRQDMPGWKVAIVILLLIVGWVAITWKQIVASLCFGLTGRTSLVNAIGIGYGVLVISALIGGGWLVIHRELLPVVGAWLPAIVVAALAVKSAAAVAVWQLERRRPCLGMRLLAKSAALWLAIVAAVAGAGAWLIPPALSPVWMTVACAALLVPFNRLAAAPSALAWNRHR